MHLALEIIRYYGSSNYALQKSTRVAPFVAQVDKQTPFQSGIIVGVREKVPTAPKETVKDHFPNAPRIIKFKDGRVWLYTCMGVDSLQELTCSSRWRSVSSPEEINCARILSC